MYINGKWLTPTAKTFTSRNPATGEKIGDVFDGGREHAADAIEAAHRAFKSWAGTTADGRCLASWSGHAAQSAPT